MSSERFTFGGENITMDSRPLDTDLKTISGGNPDYSEKAFPIPKYDDDTPKAGRRKIVDEFVDNATTHGIPRILNSSRPLLSRLFWFVITLALVGALLYQGSQLVIAYCGRPTTTKISLVTKSKLEFPAVTICNLNMIRRSKLKDTRFQGLADLDRDPKVQGIGLDEADYPEFYPESSSPVVSPSPPQDTTNSPPNRRRRAVDDEYSYDNDDYDYEEFESIKDPNDWEAFYNQSTSSDYSDFRAVVRPTVDELREYGHQAKDFILQCTFDTEPCTFKNFTVIQNAQYGNCFVFNNAHKLKKKRRTTTTRTGSQYGLHLTLMVEQPEYIGILSPDSGVKVAITDPRIYAFPEDDGIAAAPGFATSIAIKKTTINRLSYPYGDCKRAHSNYYQPEKYDFSQRSCSKLCLQKTMNSNCSCITDILINGTMCGAIDKAQVQCRSGVLKKFLRNKLNCDCSNPCSETVFNPRISSSRWPSARYEGHMYNRLAEISKKAARILASDSQSRNNLVRLSVFFEELNFERVQESPMITEEALFGGVGGLMGLYVGMSFISLMEIAVFLMELLRSLCCSKRHSSNKQTKVSGR